MRIECTLENTMDAVVASPAPLQTVALQTSPAQALMVVEPPVDDQELKTPKKRAETWVQDEIKALIALRKEMDNLFNTSKSNKHLWEQISIKMKERGYERSATMCTDKWRNLLKEFKKAKHQDRGGSAKVACYKDLEELLGDRIKAQTPVKAALSVGKIEPSAPVVTPTTKGATRSALNLERRLSNDGHAIPSTNAAMNSDQVPANGIAPLQPHWNWRESNSNGGERRSAGGSYGKIIVVKYGEMSRRIRIDGPYESIKESIKTTFGLRSKRGFWLEDDDGVVQTVSPDMPAGEYTLNLDQGVTVKLCPYEGSPNTEHKTLYSEEDFHEFLARRGWSGLREVGNFRDVDSLEELREGAVYQQAGGAGANHMLGTEPQKF